LATAFGFEASVLGEALVSVLGEALVTGFAGSASSSDSSSSSSSSSSSVFFLQLPSPTELQLLATALWL